MGKQSRLVKQIPVKVKEGKEIEDHDINFNNINVTVHYTKGRGLFMWIEAVEIGESNGFRTTKGEPFSAKRVKVMEMKRFSAKKLEAFEPDAELLKTLVDQVLEEKELELV
jgi:hypothetical protein